jgi:hypothetical protein
VKERASLLRKLNSLLIPAHSNKNITNEKLSDRKIFEKHKLFKTKNNIRLKEVTKLILEIRKGSLKINSSIMGDMTVIFKIYIGVNLSSLRDGNKLKYFNGSTIKIPAIMSITIRTRNDFQTSDRKLEMELIS